MPTLAVGPDDHVWVFNRSRQIRPDENGASTNPPRTDCCIAGPAILEFDPAGNLLQGWGGPGYVPNWPNEQTINIDRESNVWISGTGRGESILEFSRTGKLLKDFGHRPPPIPSGQTPPPLVENNQQTDVFISGVGFLNVPRYPDWPGLDDFTGPKFHTSRWDYEYTGDDSTVTVHVRRLRSKIEADPARPAHIKTVWGVGYKFEG